MAMAARAASSYDSVPSRYDKKPARLSGPEKIDGADITQVRNSEMSHAIQRRFHIQ
jgi:hypothetical protein